MSRLRGRFTEPVADEMQRFSSSMRVDLEMLHEEIQASTAHAQMLGKVGLISAAETVQIVSGLERVHQELKDGSYEPAESLEDIHMAVESRLMEILGAVGGKLHTARSRNDQVATAVRLWMKSRVSRLVGDLDELIGELLARIRQDGRTLMPGYTHLQRGQPILLGHHLLAHVWPLTRDRARLGDAYSRLDRCPLGGCAMAGTTLPIDREFTANSLGFVGPVENALDAVAARDHELEVMATCAISMTHLSRMAEEIVLWSSAEFDFVEVGEGYSTGSSIMPQKRNPDAAELIRGKASRVQGNLSSALGLVKGLPLAYNRDLQETKELLFSTVMITISSVRIMAGMWHSLTIHRDRFTEEMRADFSLATELADALVLCGTPFREAHQAVAGLVRDLEAAGRDLSALTIEELRTVHPDFQPEVLGWLDPWVAIERRSSLGGTAWSEIERQVEMLETRMAETESRSASDRLP
ncbi:MAG: argininosuccinate lyase [Thermoanaerobaculia bacterium]